MATHEVPNDGARRNIRTTLSVAAALLGTLVLVDPLTPIVSAAVDPTTATVTGVVYADDNGNGSQDADEEGIENVSVSDGATLTQTDETGRYTISTDVTRRITDLVFVSQPAGYTVGKDEYSTARFYRDLGQLTEGTEQTATSPWSRTRRAGRTPSPSPTSPTRTPTPATRFGPLRHGKLRWRRSTPPPRTWASSR